MNTPLVNALASALFHFLWEGAALALLLAVALAIIRAAKIRYAFACAALFSMAAAFVVTLALLYPHNPTFRNPINWPNPALVAPGPSGHATVPLATRLEALMRDFVPLWFAGIALFYLKSAGSCIAVARLRRVGVFPASSLWQNRLDQLAARLNVTRAVTLFESRLVDVPVVAGFLRPVILIPAGFLAGMPPEQLEYLLIHELAHVRRLDYFVNLLQKAVEGLLFYHPAIWWVSGVIAKERENCCDDIVLSLHPEPRRYASTLAALEHSRWAAMPAASGGNLSERIRRILNRPETSHTAHTPALIVVLMAISAAVAFAALQQPARAQARSAEGTERAYRKWIDEDVAYIIQDQERRAFKDLTTDEERENFIDQFWQRRNPTPGSPTNPFKEEHYRRIDFANGHFSSSTMPGWKTDEGRIYITFGPPDEIDAHIATCSIAVPAYEQWRYRWIEGVGNNVIIEFKDASCTGEYRMTGDPATAQLQKVR